MGEKERRSIKKDGIKAKKRRIKKRRMEELYRKNWKRKINERNSKEVVGMLIGFFAGIAAIGELAYGNIYAGFYFLPFLPIYYISARKQKTEEKEYQKMIQFKDAINSIGASLEAGYSMENAIRTASRDLACIYAKDAWIRTEIEKVARNLENAVPTEEALRMFAAQSGLEDARSFAEIYATARKSGGDLLQIIRSAAEVISDKAEVRREIRTILTAKQLECRIMNLIPPGILIYFRVFSPGLIDFFYHGLLGRGFMTGLLCFYFFLAWQMRRMADIRM